MKKLTLLIFFVSLTLFLTGCGTNPLSVSEIEISKRNLYLAVGQTEVISAQVYPFNATNQNVTWFSSNKDVVTIDNGFVSAVGIGEAQIEVFSEDGGYKDYCNVLVTSARDNLALNNYNNMSLSLPEEQSVASTKTNTQNYKNYFVNKLSKLKSNLEDDLFFTGNNIKTDSLNWLRNFNDELSLAFSETKASLISEIISTRENLLNQFKEVIEQLKDNVENEQYEISDINNSGVTFVVIKK